MIRSTARDAVIFARSGCDELAADGIYAREVVEAAVAGIVVEDYPDYPKGARMRKQRRTKLIHEGQYLAEVDVELLVNENEWSPYLSTDDAYKLDDVRDALRKGDIATASRHGRVFVLTPVAV